MASYLSFVRMLSLTATHTNIRPYQRLHSQLVHASYRYKSTKSSEEEIDLDQPLKFSTSRAATWQARDTYGSSASEDKMPWYQPYVVAISLSTFLLYFCVWREESDMDSNLKRTLYDHIEGLEEKQLELALEHSIQTGNDTSTINTRLKEIRETKKDKADPA